MCRYFFEQLGSGHSIRDGEADVLDVDAGSATGLEAPLELDRERFTLLASSAALPPLPLLLLFRLAPRSNMSLAGLLGGPPLLPPPRRPLAPLRSLLCIGLMDESIIIIPPEPLPLPLPDDPLPAPEPGIGVPPVAPRPLLALPLGALDSASLVGESQNLAGFQETRLAYGEITKCYVIQTWVVPNHSWCSP